MYLDAYMLGLQYESGVTAFFQRHRGQPLMDPIRKALVTAIHGLVHEQGVPLITFAKLQGMIHKCGLGP